MFRVSFFCDDRKLANALRALLGLAVGAPEVQPVDKDTGDTDKKQKRAYNGGGGPSLIPQLAEYLLRGKGKGTTELRMPDIRQWLVSISRNPTNAQHVARLGCKRGLLKRHGEGRDTVYTVVTDPPAIPIAKVSRRGVKVIRRRKAKR